MSTGQSDDQQGDTQMVFKRTIKWTVKWQKLNLILLVLTVCCFDSIQSKFICKLQNAIDNWTFQIENEIQSN